NGGLVLGIRAAVVGIVAQHEPKVGGAAVGRGVVVEGVARAGLTIRRAIAGRARVAQRPEADRLARADGRRALEPVVGAVVGAAHQAKRRAADRVIILRVRL